MKANDQVSILSQNTLYILLPNVDMPLDKYSLTMTWLLIKCLLHAEGEPASKKFLKFLRLIAYVFKRA